VEPFKLGHRPALDGVRGVAILLVLLSHVPTLPLQGGFIGVDLFFVLSGFLITSLLLEEWQATGTLSLGAFYARRTLRLLPALVVMLLAFVLFSEWRESRDVAAATRTSVVMTLFYSANWFLAFNRYPRAELGATWSLSVEEQFYLAWPVLLLILLRLGCSRRTMAGVVIAAMAASAATRIALLQAGATPNRIFFGTDAHADGLLVGALTGMMFSWGAAPRSPGAARALDVGALLALGLMALLVGIGWQADAAMVRFGYPALNLGAAVLIASLVSSPALRRIFEFGPLVWLGRISYGVYLWHIAVFWMLGKFNWSSGSLYWPVAFAVTFALAAASFYGLERPILRFKKRFERVGSAPSISP
jgi:peptidoglycan/LPS O-acetylase OafA/YrhL